MFKTFITLLMVLGLSACANMTFKGMYEMATFDLFELDPSQLKIAIRTDKQLHIKQGNVVINLSFISDDETLYIDEKLLPEVRQKMPISGELSDGIKSNEQVTIFNLASKDAAIMRDAILQAKEYKESGRTGVGSFGISIEDVCFNEESLINADIDILVQKSVDDDYFMFLENLNLKQLTKTDPSNKEAMESLFCKTSNALNDEG